MRLRWHRDLQVIEIDGARVLGPIADKKTRLQPDECDGAIRADRVPERYSCIAIQAGRHIDGENRATGQVDSLDHTTEGRVGWNCVTGSNDGGAQNYDRDKQWPHDERYDIADEFTDVVTRLWDSWEADAVTLDPAAPTFADGSKVHAINHAGKYFKVRGPLNAPRGPQGRAPIA